MAYPSRFVEWFGPCMWKTMHSIAHSYPEKPSEETRRKYIDFFRNLGAVIPCPSCGDHYDKYLSDHPIDADNRESLARWVYDLHSDVNKRKHKPNPSFEEVREAYEGWDQQKHQALASASEAEKQRRMATPLLNLKTGGASELMTAEADRLTKYIAIGCGVFLLIFFLQRMRARGNDEAKAK